MSHDVEKDWTTEAGLRAVALVVRNSHRCGYVGVPKDHPLYGVEYNEPHPALKLTGEEEMGKRGIIPFVYAARQDIGNGVSGELYFDVHGSLTYSSDFGEEKPGESKYPVASDLWWFGFDCHHSGDGSLNPRAIFHDGPVRDLPYVVAECESLARQLAAVVRVTP